MRKEMRSVFQLIRTGVCGYALFFSHSSYSLASEVSGKIVLQKKPRKQVLAPAVYDLRGMAMSDQPSGREPVNEFDRVAVWLESERDEPAPPARATMQQRNRRFEPELLVIPVGSVVEFPNFDAIFHNIFSLSRTQGFDLGYYPKGQSRIVKFPRSGIVQVYCHVHPSMYAAIVVTSSRWSGKPAQDGSFSWPDVPHGNYRLTIWQKFVGVFRKDFVVPEVGDVAINVSIPVEEPENVH
jgi:plastocyanin